MSNKDFKPAHQFLGSETEETICGSTDDDHSTEGQPSDSIKYKKVSNFPQKLYQILANEAYSSMIAWLPSGESFIIKDRKEFLTKILPKYLKESKFSSFSRKLRRWGFQRSLSGKDKGAYFHKYFIRENPNLLSKMACAATASIAKPSSSPIKSSQVTSPPNTTQDLSGNNTIDYKNQIVTRPEVMSLLSLSKEYICHTKRPDAEKTTDSSGFITNTSVPDSNSHYYNINSTSDHRTMSYHVNTSLADSLASSGRCPTTALPALNLQAISDAILHREVQVERALSEMRFLHEVRLHRMHLAAQHQFNGNT